MRMSIVPCTRRGPRARVWGLVLATSLNAALCSAEPGPVRAFSGLRLDDGLSLQAPASPAPPPAVPRRAEPTQLQTDCGVDGMAQAITLRNAMALALCRAPATRETWARIQAATAQWQAEQLQGRPNATLTLGRGFQSSRQSDAEQPAQTVRGHAHGIVLEASWLVFDFGQRDAVVQAAAHLVRAAGATHDRVVQDTALAAGRAYFNLVEAKALLAQLQQSELATQRVLQLAMRPRRDEEALDRLGVLQARTAIEQLRLERTQAKGAYEQARGALASALGLPPQAPIDVQAEDVLHPPPGMAEDTATLLRRALEDNPNLRAARARLEAAQAELDGARRAGRPTLSVVHGARRERDAAGGRAATWSVGLELSLPLLDLGLRRQRIAQAKHEAEAARAELLDLNRSTELDAWSALMEMSSQLNSHQQADRLLVQAQELLAAETDAFEKGDGDMFDVLDAQHSVDEAVRERLATALASAFARLRIAAALGQLAAPH